MENQSGRGWTYLCYMLIQLGILIGITVVVTLFFLYLAFCSKKKKYLPLIALNGVVTRQHVRGEPKYLICGRECHGDEIKSSLICPASLLIAVCTSLFWLLVIVEIKDD